MKTLKVSEETHTKLKIYCAKNKLKINEYIDKVIKFLLSNKINIE